MKLSRIRKIDFYLGVPLCFVLTAVYRLCRVIHTPPVPPVTRVLFIELSEMGSAILLDPAMRKLRRQTGAQLHFVIFLSTVQSLSLLGTVRPENTFVIDDTTFLSLCADTFRYMLWCRRNGIDAAVDCELFSRYSSILTIISGGSRRIGFHRFHTDGLYRGDFLTHRVAYNPHQHIAKNFMALVEPLVSGADSSDEPQAKIRIRDDEIAIDCPEPDKEAIREVLHEIASRVDSFDIARHRIALVNVNACDRLPIRQWPEANFRGIALRLLDRYDNLLLLYTGAEREREQIQEHIDTIGNGRCINFSGAVPFHTLTALYHISAFMLTSDSGPAHFAAVTGLKTFVMYGPETPELYGSLAKNSTAYYAGLACSPCLSAFNHRSSPCTDNVCMKAITPDEVYRGITRYFDASEIRALDEAVAKAAPDNGPDR